MEPKDLQPSSDCGKRLVVVCLGGTYGYTPVLVSSHTIHSLNVPSRESMYFEDCQIRVLLDAPGKEKPSERRNRMILILGYDTALRIGEVTGLKVCNLHLDAEIPYIRILGKGKNYQYSTSLVHDFSVLF